MTRQETLTASHEALTARLRCHYANPARAAQRPYCAGVGVVAYGSIVLCQSCDMYRSAVGRTDAPRKLAGAELLKLVEAAAELARAEDLVGRAVGAARAAGASWAEVGDALGTSRQAAQQRFASGRTSE
jgi:hypothetical protein